MKTIKLEAYVGSTFDNVAKEAQELSRTGKTVEFDFNGVKCLVNENTNLQLLYRDYSNSWLMGWKEVGPNCLETYPPKMQAKFEKRSAERETKRQQQEKEYREKEAKEKADAELKAAGIVLDVLDWKVWGDWRAKNTDGYGNACFEYADIWGRLMQVELGTGKTLKQVFEKCERGLGYLGISGAQHGMAVGILAICWKHGKELKELHKR